jgi:16S rRNA (cytosine1402-N4)-methyltransferase
MVDAAAMKKQQGNKANGEAETGYHIPVLLRECMDALAIKPNGIYADCTFGGGGHSREILKALGPAGKLVAFDQDADAVANLPKDERLVFIPQNFRHIHRFLRLYGIEKLDGLLADLGVSSHQFDEGSRGFSYRFDATLDMRMNQKQSVTAADIVNGYEAGRLQQMFSAYGEVTNARTLAAAIVAARKGQPLKTIADLLAVLSPLAKGNPNRYYSQVFQALRIEVNEELEALKDLLKQLTAVIKPGGRIAIITFHSLEDRIVKQFFKQGSFELTEDPLYGNQFVSPFILITKKPIVATKEELQKNVRSRSASLRVAEVRE